MSWSDFMPILTEEMVEEALGQLSVDDEVRFQAEFGVAQVTGRTGQRPGPVIAVSLFWKRLGLGDEDPGVVTREAMFSNQGSRYHPWFHYVEPLLTNGPLIIQERPEVTIRVYLAHDLDFLVPELSEFAEVTVMKGSSVAGAPGMLWRFLALENEGDEVTVLDADLIRTALVKTRLTGSLRSLGLGTWRIPVPHDMHKAQLTYRTIAGGNWGSCVSLPVNALLRAFRWWQRRGQLPVAARHPASLAAIPMFGAEWPAFGSDEYFNNLVLYPRLAGQGLLTLLSEPSASFFLPLDIEYATWACAASIVTYSLAHDMTAEPIRHPDGREQALPRGRLPDGELRIFPSAAALIVETGPGDLSESRTGDGKACDQAP